MANAAAEAATGLGGAAQAPAAALAAQDKCEACGSTDPNHFTQQRHDGGNSYLYVGSRAACMMNGCTEAKHKRLKKDHKWEDVPGGKARRKAASSDHASHSGDSGNTAVRQEDHPGFNTKMEVKDETLLEDLLVATGNSKLSEAVEELHELGYRKCDGLVELLLDKDLTDLTSEFPKGLRAAGRALVRFVENVRRIAKEQKKESDPDTAPSLWNEDRCLLMRCAFKVALEWRLGSNDQRTAWKVDVDIDRLTCEIRLRRQEPLPKDPAELKKLRDELQEVLKSMLLTADIEDLKEGSIIVVFSWPTGGSAQLPAAFLKALSRRNAKFGKYDLLPFENGSVSPKVVAFNLVVRVSPREGANELVAQFAHGPFRAQVEPIVPTSFTLLRLGEASSSAVAAVAAEAPAQQKQQKHGGASSSAVAAVAAEAPAQQKQQKHGGASSSAVAAVAAEAPAQQKQLKKHVEGDSVRSNVMAWAKSSGPGAWTGLSALLGVPNAHVRHWKNQIRTYSDHIDSVEEKLRELHQGENIWFCGKELAVPTPLDRIEALSRKRVPSSFGAASSAPPSKQARVRWTQQEEAALLKLFTDDLGLTSEKQAWESLNWPSVASKLGTGRCATAVMHRGKKLLLANLEPLIQEDSRWLKFVSNRHDYRQVYWNPTHDWTGVATSLEGCEMEEEMFRQFERELREF